MYCRNSDTLLGAGSPQTNWVQLAGSRDLNFNQSTGKFVSSTSNTFSNLTAGNFDLSGLDFTGLELRSTNRTNGLQQFTSQSAATSVLELSGIEDLGRARTALDQIGVKRDQISSYRGTIGAMQSRLSTAAALLLSSKEQSLAAESRIRDVDVAQESANYVAAQIRQQASAAVMSRVKMQQKLILQLL